MLSKSRLRVRFSQCAELVLEAEFLTVLGR